jgi:hypothetical protein
MFNSTVLDVAVGLIFSFLAVSLLVSAIMEALASALMWRSNTLLKGVKDLLNDPDFGGLARALYNNALVNPRDDGKAKAEQDLRRAPAYIDPKQFAAALTDVIGITAEPADKIREKIAAQVSDKQVKDLLIGIADRTNADLPQIRDELAAWFDSSMDRVSGAYKRKTQLWSFVVALSMAAIFNISSINIGKALWQQPMVIKTIAPTPGMRPAEAVEQLAALGAPIGWNRATLQGLSATSSLEMLLGWLITAVATLFGAPFWFDALEQIVRLKGSGPSPAEKRANVGAAA